MLVEIEVHAMSKMYSSFLHFQKIRNVDLESEIPILEVDPGDVATHANVYIERCSKQNFQQ